MSAVPKRLLTPQEYLEQERLAPFKSEYYQGEVFAMAGASVKHCTVKDNLAYHIRSALQKSSCRVTTNDLRVKVVATGLYTYPDLVIYCGTPQLEDDVFDTLLNPVVIIEVLSDSTEKYDRGVKFAHYRQIPSLNEYVLVSQDHVFLERYVRQPDNTWSLTDFTDVSQSFELKSVPVSIPIAEIYEGVELSAQSLREISAREI